MVRYDKTEIPDGGGRARRARNSLGREEIVAAARETLAEKSLDGFTIRAIADRLGASPMSLYNHVTSREELLDLALDELLSELRLSDDADRDWREVVVGFAMQHLGLLLANPWAVRALLTRPDPGRGATAIGEAYLATVLRGGLDEREAVLAFTGVIALVYGAAGFLAAAGATSGTQSREAVAEVIDAVAVDEFPATARVASELAQYGSPEQFAALVSALVSGLRR